MTSSQGLTDGELGAIAEVMRILGHETRLRLVDTLRVQGELAVGELEAATGIGQPGLSQQLAVLRKAELVNARRAAKQVYYSLAPQALVSAVALLTNMASDGKTASLPPGVSSDKELPARGSAAMFARIL
ncbi:metalloregulator ArsR/SmtB family transcription factor [Sphingobium aquiterrae]|uniref:ArsR/SmtB family transcription factor n=1 Tax=Sphingobium aquiterrae TaxID=2038656 RepID=UPI003019E333